MGTHCYHAICYSQAYSQTSCILCHALCVHASPVVEPDPLHLRQLHEISALQATPVEARDKLFCHQDAAARTWLHDVTGAVPVCAVAPPSTWTILKELLKERKFRNAGAQAQLRVG